MRRESGYWQDWGNVERELKVVIGKRYVDEEEKVIKKKGEFPTHEQLRKIDFGLLNAITRYHGGLREVSGRVVFANMTPKDYAREVSDRLLKLYSTDELFGQGGLMEFYAMVDRNLASKQTGSRQHKHRMVEIELPKALEKGGAPSWSEYGLLPLNTEARTLLPGYRVPFQLNANGISFETYETSAPGGTRRGSRRAGYVAKGMREFYRHNPGLKPGHVLVLEEIVPGKRYALHVK